MSTDKQIIRQYRITITKQEGGSFWATCTFEHNRADEKHSSMLGLCTTDVRRSLIDLIKMINQTQKENFEIPAGATEMTNQDFYSALISDQERRQSLGLSTFTITFNENHSTEISL